MSGVRVEEERLARDIEAIARMQRGRLANRLQPSDVLPLVAARPRLRASPRRERPAATCASMPPATCTRGRALCRRSRRPGCAGPTSTRCPREADSTASWGRGRALEVLRAAPAARRGARSCSRKRREPPFGLGMVGSRAWAGTLGPEKLRRLRNRQGQDYFCGGRRARSCRRTAWPRSDCGPASYLGLIETHVEQGPGDVEGGHSRGRGHGHRRPEAVRLRHHGRSESRGRHHDEGSQGCPGGCRTCRVCAGGVRQGIGRGCRRRPCSPWVGWMCSRMQ